MRVLIADDEPDELRLLETLVRDLGHEVETASNALVALAIAVRFQPQIAFIDLGVPYRDGLTLARDLRKELPYIRLCAVTGRGAPRRLRTLMGGRIRGSPRQAVFIRAR